MADEWSGLVCDSCSQELNKALARKWQGYCPDCGRRLKAIDGGMNIYPVRKVGEIKRILTRLRFEPGQRVPDVGATWLTRTELGGRLVRVKLLEVRETSTHPDGATLVDARVYMAFME